MDLITTRKGLSMAQEEDADEAPFWPQKGPKRRR